MNKIAFLAKFKRKPSCESEEEEYLLEIKKRNNAAKTLLKTYKNDSAFNSVLRTTTNPLHFQAILIFQYNLQKVLNEQNQFLKFEIIDLFIEALIKVLNQSERNWKIHQKIFSCQNQLFCKQLFPQVVFREEKQLFRLHYNGVFYKLDSVYSRSKFCKWFMMESCLESVIVLLDAVRVMMNLLTLFELIINTYLSHNMDFPSNNSKQIKKLQTAIEFVFSLIDKAVKKTENSVLIEEFKKVP